VKQHANADTQAARELRRAALAQQRGASPGVSGQMARLPPGEGQSVAKGWALWLGWGIGLLALLSSGATGVLFATALVTPISLSASTLQALLLLPVAGGALAVPVLVLALLVTRRARRAGARMAALLSLVGLATALLVAAILFGGLVAAPRSTLASFAQTIKGHCARVAQVLAPYGTPPASAKLLANARPVLVALQGAESLLPGDQQVLSTLVAPEPTYQPLVEDCRALAQDDTQFIASLQQSLEKLPPDQAQAMKTIMNYSTTTGPLLAEVQRLGNQLARAIFAPFQQA
jgi:hypothetical protein